MSEPTLTTYSFWNTFRNCRRACKWRYVDQIAPIKTDAALSFGTVIHQSLDAWHRGDGLNAVISSIDQAYQAHQADPNRHTDWHNARAMMAGYAAAYREESWTVVALEHVFRGRIANPETGRASRALTIAGKVDGIVQIGGEYFLLEHKTAATLDGNYLDKLWTDLQITLYAHQIEQTKRVRISGVIYNILVKARLQQGRGETEEEYETRRADLLAKSKTGKTTAQRKLPESDADFADRLAAKYREPGMFHREALYISADQRHEMRRDIWELAQQFLDARRRGVFNRNTSYCFNFNRPCAYLPLCQANGDARLLMDNLYEIRPPHEELLEGNGQTLPEEVF